MKCTCVIEGNQITELCDIHRAAGTQTHNAAIDSVARMIMNATNERWLVERVRGMKASEPYKRCQNCDD